MKKIHRRILRFIGFLLIAALLTLGVFLLWLHLYSYRPAERETLEIKGKGAPLIDRDTLSFCTWNLGYAGLGKEMDFFYEGGKAVRPDKASSEKYLNGITKALRILRSDFFLFQEVDTYSKRSYYRDQTAEITNVLTDYAYAYAVNYQSAFVPQPISEPFGKVNSGIALYSRFIPENSVRQAYPPEASFPMCYFLLDRCCMIQQYSLKNGKKLIVVNTHNSAFDDGSKRKEQLGILKKILLDEFGKGNYVIAGGDWNQCPQDYRPASDYYAMKIEKDFPAAGWTCAFDPVVPSNRSVEKPYNKETTRTSVLDFFFLSPNVKLIQVQCSDMGFEFSDHNPVLLQVVLQ